jgi:paraquat-inducible protein B
MSERTPPDLDAGDVAEAVVDTRRRPSIVWLIPLVAALVGGFVAWRTFSERGPEIRITFDTAEGLEAGKTKVRYKNVEVGLVDEVQLAPDLSHVVCRARMVKGADVYLKEGTRFWVVKARVAGGQVTGLGTIFSGAYIGLDPVREGKRAREFRGLEVPPVVTTDEPGRHFVLHSYRAGSMDVGTPVFFRRIQVGEVVESELDPSGEFVAIKVFVHAPNDERVHRGTRFWNASGIDVTMSAEGVQVDTESVVSMLIGGVAFDTPEGDAGERAEDGAVFPLYENHDATKREIYTEKTAWLLYFDQSVRGLAAGSPVEFRGIPVGHVRDVKLEVDPKLERFRIPVVIEIEPERFGYKPSPDREQRRKTLEGLVASGMRAQLKSGNLLTGQLVVELDMHPDAAPAQIVWQEPYPVFPTIPTALEEITESLTQLVKRLEKIPFDRIGADLSASLTAARASLVQAERTLASTNDMVAPNSSLNQELQRALLELTDAARSLGLAADQIEREPNSLIFGKGKDE